MYGTSQSVHSVLSPSVLGNEQHKCLHHISNFGGLFSFQRLCCLSASATGRNQGEKRAARCDSTNAQCWTYKYLWELWEADDIMTGCCEHAVAVQRGTEREAGM